MHLRSNDLNEIHILLLQLARSDLSPVLRNAAAEYLADMIERNRSRWSALIGELSGELAALEQTIDARKEVVRRIPAKVTSEQRSSGEDKAARRLRQELQEWQSEDDGYKAYLAHLKALLAFRADPARRLTQNISDLVPALALGDNNSVYDLQHHIAGPSPAGLVAAADGRLDDTKSFQQVNYFPLLADQRVRNNPQTQLSSRPIDFMAMDLPDAPYAPEAQGSQHAYWLYGSEDRQLVLLQDAARRLSLKPVRGLWQDQDGKVQWTAQSWRAGLPLQLFEDSQLHLPAGEDRSNWLCGWHTEQEWFSATHKCRYSNAVIGLTEELSPVEENFTGRPGISPVLLRYERRRRQLVQPDFHVFASDHWNFNVRFPNPGGNHGSFLRISTHSVWMMAGAGIAAEQIEQPSDSLNFASTILSLLGRTPPMPDRVVSFATLK